MGALEGWIETLGKEVFLSVGAMGSRLGAHVGSANRMCSTRDDAGGVSDLGSVVNRRAAVLSTRSPPVPPFQSPAGVAGSPNAPVLGGSTGLPSGAGRGGSWGRIAPYGMVFGRQTVIHSSCGGPPRLGPRRVPELGFTPPAPVQLTGERFVGPAPRVAPTDIPAQRAGGQSPAPSRLSMSRHPESAFSCYGYPPISTVQQARSREATLTTAVEEGQNLMATERTKGSQ